MNKIWENQQYQMMESGGTIIIVCLICLFFCLFYKWVLPENPGSLSGAGLGGIIGVVGIAFGPLGFFVGVALGGMLGGLIYGGIYQARVEMVRQPMTPIVANPHRNIEIRMVRNRITVQSEPTDVDH